MCDIIGEDAGDGVVKLLLSPKCFTWCASFEALYSWMVPSSKLTIIVFFVIVVIGEVLSFPTLKAKAILMYSVLLYL
jgi:hypothetical protein